MTGRPVSLSLKAAASGTRGMLGCSFGSRIGNGQEDRKQSRRDGDPVVRGECLRIHVGLKGYQDLLDLVRFRAHDGQSPRSGRSSLRPGLPEVLKQLRK